MRVVWLDGALVEPAGAALSIDDPAVRWGEGLFETMRADSGRVPLLARHLDRLRGSVTALRLAPMPEVDEVRAAVGAALAAFGDGPASVRVTATPAPTLLVEVVPRADGLGVASAIALRGAWLPGDVLAEHKTLSYGRHRLSQRRAEAEGADHALLLDADGRLGEAALASVFCAIEGTLVTAPARGLLPGIARAVVRESLGGREEALDEPAWRSADEIVLTNAVRGAVAVVEVDGRPVGGGAPGPWAAAIARALSAAGAA